MAKKTYLVARHMIGDKEYLRGDKRTLTEAEAAYLVASGALVEQPRSEAREAAEKAAAEKAAAEKASADRAS